MTKNFDIYVQASVLLVLCMAWELTARLGGINPYLLPSLSSVMERLFNDLMSGKALVELSLTLYRALAGFGIAALVAIPIGILMSQTRVFRWFFEPIISVGFPMPKVAFLPIFILWFDVYDTSKIVIVAFTCFFPIVATTYAGTRNIDKWPLWSARALGAKEYQLLGEVVLPMAMPQILTGLQIALPVGLIAAIVAEMIMGGHGVGGAMINAGRYADSVGVFTGIVEVIILGSVVLRLVNWVRRKLLVWHPESQSK